MHLDSALVGELAERIGEARKVYGTDSPYVIGIITAIEWIAQGTDGGEDLKRELFAQIVVGEEHKSMLRPSPAGVKPGNGDGIKTQSSPAIPEPGSLSENTWIKGVVKWFNNDKGYGFISTESHVDVFVHWRDISSWDRSLAQGDEVEFMVTRTAKGFQAINVMKAGQEDKGAEAESSATQSEDGEPVDNSLTDTSNERGAEIGTASERDTPTDETTEVVDDEGAVDLGEDDGRL